MEARQRSTAKRSQNLRFRTTMPSCVAYSVMLGRDWVETDAEGYDWDIFWADVHSLGVESEFDHTKLQDHQKLNHFPRHVELTRKDLMVKNLKRARKAAERDGRFKEYDFFPQTFELPLEHGPFVEEFRKSNGAVWIMKPCGRARGSGIFLMDRLSQLTAWRREREEQEKAEIYVASRYLERPLLVAGRKFDLRLYVLVLSFQPLQVYLHRGGFCRFSTARFDMEKENMGDLSMHLTNVAVQKRDERFEETSGMKWALHSFKIHIACTRGTAVADKLFTDIQNVVLQSLLAVQRVVTQDKHCFELYGYDVLIDEQLKPWLIEVNASPSLIPATPQDYALKYQLVDDALTLVDAEGLLQGALPASYGGFDLVWSGASHVQPHPALCSLLGCRIPEGWRNRQLP